MLKVETALGKLKALAEERASGEFVCVTPQEEIHIYLQDGRAAWATTSNQPFAFASHLQASTGIDVETFKQVVDECRREKLPLGETLVDWALASWDDVRGSLWHQIRHALVALAASEESQTLFLPRAYAKYREELTFDVSEGSPHPGARSVAEDAPAQPATPALRGEAPDLAHRVLEAVDGLSWVEVFEEGRLVESDPEAELARTPADLTQATLGDGAAFAAVRSPGSSLIGLQLSPTRSLWSRLSAGSSFGAAVSVLSALLPAAESEPTGSIGDETSWSIGDEKSELCRELCGFVERGREILAALVLPHPSRADSVSGSGSSSLDPEHCVDLARRRSRAFCCPDLPIGGEEERLHSIGFSARTLVSSEGELWCLGSEGADGESFWVFVDRRHAQGLGWALLAALVRTLARVRSGEAA